VAAQDGGVIGICVGTPVMLRKVDKNFQLIWEKPVEQFIDTTTPSIYFREDQPGDIDEQIIQGANASVWVIDGLNYGNFAQTQNNLPLSLRSALAMTSFDATTGEKLVAIKHYGLLPLKAISIGEREVWMSVKTLDTSACYLGDCSEEHLNAIFDSSNGAMKGYTSGNFGGLQILIRQRVYCNQSWYWQWFVSARLVHRQAIQLDFAQLGRCAKRRF
jgi:hypothetical protein